MITQADHIGINVKDMQQSVRFYTQVLGLALLGEPVGDDTVRMQYLGIPGGVAIELLEYLPSAPHTAVAGIEAGLYRHLALRVEKKSDLEQYYQKLVAAGREFPMIQVNRPDYLPYLDMDILLFTDPNGVEVELCVKRSA